jgi:hypothetical protein
MAGGPLPKQHAHRVRGLLQTFKSFHRSGPFQSYRAVFVNVIVSQATKSRDGHAPRSRAGGYYGIRIPGGALGFEICF